MTYARAALAGLAGLATAALLGVSGCNGDDPDGGDPTTAPPPSPTSTATPSPTAAAPTVPPAAQQHTAAGAAAFVRYWYAAMRYSAMTGNSQILLDASTDECDSCTALAKYDAELHAAGGDYEDLPWHPTITMSKAERDYFVVTTDVASPEYRFRRTTDGPWLRVRSRARHHLIRVTFNAQDGWRVIHYADQVSGPKQ